mgnify:CR=1 FL=1
MANIDNKCKDLEITDFYKERNYNKENSSLGDLYHLQGITQKMYFDKQHKPRFSDMNIGQLIDFLMINNHAIIDELHELTDAVGGIADGVGNAAWKPWKSKNKDIRSKNLSDLSDDDLKELKMEFIDIMHFVFNIGLAIGIDEKEIYNYYLSKNKENWNRANSGY